MSIGSSKDKKKKQAKQKEALALLKQQQDKKDKRDKNTKSTKSDTSSSASSSNNKGDQQVIIEIDDKGTTLTLKLFDGAYICTGCLSQYHLGQKKKSGLTNVNVSKLKLECSMCGTAEHSLAEERRKETSELQRVSKNSIGSGVKGLSNLGNTCFFNSIMQNLTHVNALRDALLVLPGSSDSSVRCTEALTMEMHYFMIKMYKLHTPHISPSALFSVVSKKSPRFLGFKQQDAHELLRCLLDILISEEQVSAKSKRDPTYIDKIFGGRLISVITCFHCGNVSKTYEPFLDLSLPLPSGPASSAHSGALPHVVNRVIKQHSPLDDLPPYDEDDKEDASSSTTVPNGPRGPRVSKHQAKKQRAKERKEQERLAQEMATEDDMVMGSLVDVDEVEISRIVEQQLSLDIANKADPSATTQDQTESDQSAPSQTQDGADISAPRVVDDKDVVAKEHTSDNTAVPAPEPTPASTKVEPAVSTPSPPASPIVGPTSPVDLSVSTEFELLNNSGTHPTTPTVTTTKDIDTSFHSEQQLSTYNLIENYECTEDPEPLMDEQQAQKIVKEFVKLGKESSSSSDKDVQVNAIDLRQNVPSEARSLDTLLSCLMQFTNPDKLEGENGFICSRCTSHAKNAKLNNSSNSITIEDIGVSTSVIIPEYDSSVILDRKDQVLEPLVDEQKVDNVQTIDNIPTVSSIETTVNDGLTVTAQPEAQVDAIPEAQPVAVPITPASPLTSPTSPETAEDAKPAAGKKKKNKKKKSTDVTTPTTATTTKKKQQEEEVVRRNASKQYLLANTPPYLTIHLKRFMQVRNGFQKNGKHITYPLTLDLTAFTDQSHDSDQYRYRLNGIVEHSGGMGSGHYVAYVYDDSQDRWYYVSDSTYRHCSLSDVLQSQAYILFYKRESISTNHNNSSSNNSASVVDNGSSNSNSNSNNDDSVAEDTIKDTEDQMASTTTTDDTEDETDKQQPATSTSQLDEQPTITNNINNNE
ncbi:hypothetical protein SAMD00019534_121690 [Acytostelium subglobosum LB1]|uniref:hypothetical protein n=1 Tax=Acytostelium subglobosum LB1 TaxID=1410327 RepID=UPI0006449A79|nr:hypothetical protein SAMD00019534_121690 [Acytostelium subglobosum LB1]GAM28993.1 hypothetical protein SAMD00019534_121690 [Acytostelium subglobosum LB1]|eukprot:XP_012747999.1 hypothetical protein SAMD00019534_121690 [Acytostelium subglobosum LB1]